MPVVTPSNLSREELDTRSNESNEANSRARAGGVTRRVVVLCLALAVFFGYIIPVIDLRLMNTFLGGQHLPIGAVGVLIVLLLVLNPLMRMVKARYGFGRNEVLTIYISCLFSCLVPGHGAENFFVTFILGPFYFATRENRWLKFLEPNLPSWMSPALWADQNGTYGTMGRRAVEDWYTGNGGQIPWGAWTVPLLAWSALCAAIYVMLACMSVMLRAQWAEREALTFPLLRLPLELTEDLDRDDKYGALGHLFRNPLMWIGFGIAAFIQLMNGLSFYYPDVPIVPMGLNTIPYLSDPPWNQIGPLTLAIYPAAIGLSFLLTSEISFSMWFFFWLMKFQYIAAYYAGFSPAVLPSSVGAGGKTFAGYQQVGAYLAYGAIVLWTAREHLRHVARRAFGREKAKPGEAREMMSYPVAFWGFVLGFAFVIAWSMAAGLRLDIALALWGLYLMGVLVLTRVVAEGGLLFVALGWGILGSMAQLTNAGPGTWLPTSSLVPAAMIDSPIMRSLRGNIMPSFLQSFKLAHDRKLNARPLLALICAVIAVSFVMGVVMRVKMGYEYGGLQFHGYTAKVGPQGVAQTANALYKGAPDTGLANWIWLSAGAGLTYAMMLARSHLTWFPLHPIGYIMTFSYPVQTLWFSILMGWMFKVTITRFGGTSTYRRAVPAFLGLALGDVTMILFWLIIDGWQGRTNHWLVPT